MRINREPEASKCQRMERNRLCGEAKEQRNEAGKAADEANSPVETDLAGSYQPDEWVRFCFLGPRLLKIAR
jgi:hypothetical protein